MRSFDEVLTKLGWGFDLSNATPGPVGAGRLVGLMDDNRPVAIQIQWAPRDGHIVLVCGYRFVGPDLVVYIRDPLDGVAGQPGVETYDRELWYESLHRYTQHPDGGRVGRWSYTFHPNLR